MKTLLEVIAEHKNLCWYPSADSDFRGLLYLSGRYFEWKNSRNVIDELPDLFIMSDICPRGYTSYSDVSLNGGESGESEISNLKNAQPVLETLYNGYRRKNRYSLYKRLVTNIRATEFEELDRIDLGIYKEGLEDLILSENIDSYNGRAFLIKAHIISYQPETINGKFTRNRYEYDADVVYVLADNLYFARDFILKHNIPIRYLIQIRYGEASGGSAIGGDWIGYLLKRFRCEYFMGNPHYLVKDNPNAKTAGVLSNFFGETEYAIPTYHKLCTLRDPGKCTHQAINNTDDWYGLINLYSIA